MAAPVFSFSDFTEVSFIFILPSAGTCQILSNTVKCCKYLIIHYFFLESHLVIW